MDERVDRLERTVAELRRAVVQLELRIAQLESATGAEAAVFPRAAEQLAAAPAPGTDAAGILAVLGRTCIVLGGAFLLRALTDAHTLPRPAGTLLGLVYGLAWFAMAWRAAGARAVFSAAMHSVTGSLIAFPLLWEATATYGLLAQGPAAVAVGGVTSLALAVAWHRRLQALAWIGVSAGLLSALAFMAAATGDSVAPMACYLAYLGVVTLWLGYTMDWTWLRWPVAFVADATVLAMVANASDVWHRQLAGTVMGVQTVLFGAYVVSFAARTLWRSRRVVPFEVAQTIALLVIAFGGAAYLMVMTGWNPAGLGIAALVFGLGNYAAAFAFLGWRGDHWRNLVFYASLGLVLTVAGAWLSASATTCAVAWTLLAVLSAAGGRRFGTITLGFHAAIYTIAAAAASGLLAHATDALMAGASQPWPPLTFAGLFALAGGAVAAAIPLSSVNESWGPASRLPKILVAVAVLWCTGGAVAGLAVPALAGQPGSGAADMAVVASVRTVILALSLLWLAWAGRGLFAEGRWLMYVVLGAGAIKLVAEDFPHGRPSTLFLTLAVYGAALTLGPRLGARPPKIAPAARTAPTQPS